MLSTPTLTWTSLIFLLSVHLIVNRMGVRAVKMKSLNRQRANMVFSTLLEHEKVLTPKEVSDRELIFERRGGEVYRWTSGDVLGHCKFGISLNSLLRCLAHSYGHEKTGSLHLKAVHLSMLMDLFKSQQYILWCQVSRPHPFSDTAAKTRILVVLKDEVTPKAQLRAWYHGLLLARRLHTSDADSAAINAQSLDGEANRAMLMHVATTLDLANKTFEHYAQRLTAAGWDLEVPVLETHSGSRIVWENGDKAGALPGL